HLPGRPAGERQSPPAREWVEMAPRPILRPARVGLSLKRLRKSELPPRYIMRPYRFLSEPKRISKGKIHMVLALHQQGKSVEQIRQETGCVKSSAEPYIADLEAGKLENDFAPYFGIDLGNSELARLTGLWWAKFGAGRG